MKVVIVSGSVGSGKTTLSKTLANKLRFTYLDVNRVIKENSLADGYDHKRKCKIVDVKKLNVALIKQIKEYNNSNLSGVIIDSHLSHYLPKRYVDLCIITKCGVNTLKKRLATRKYSKLKIEENVEAEIFDSCFEDAKKKKHAILVVDTTKHFNIVYLCNKIKGCIKCRD